MKQERILIFKIRICLFLSAILLLLETLMMSPSAFAIEGTVEFPMIKSEVLGSKQELGVYLPPGYATSGLAYPVLYLFHGSSGTDRSYFNGTIDEIQEALVAQRRMNPVIMVAPNMPGWIYVGNQWANYFIQDIMPFVDQTYRVLHFRENRGIYGYSKGGGDVIQLAFMRPDLFSVIGAGAAAYSLPMKELEQYDAVKYPIRFWIHHGRSDTVVSFANSERLVALIKEKGWECVFESYDGDHFTIPQDIQERGQEYFSKFLGDPLTLVQPQDRLTTKWGGVKTNQ